MGACNWNSVLCDKATYTACSKTPKRRVDFSKLPSVPLFPPFYN
jgi:hypothetical protein